MQTIDERDAVAVSLAEIIILCLIADLVFHKFKIPGLVGMLLVGVVLGPYALGLIDPKLLAIGADLRLIALIVILLRAGFELSKDTLHRVGKMVILLSFIPPLFEVAAVTLLGPYLLGLSYMASAVLGTILAAVSPAVVVTLMVGFIKQRKGAQKAIPTLMLGAASLNDVVVIVVYSVLIGIYTGQQVNIAYKLMGIPLSVILGILVGLGIGMLLYYIFERFTPRTTKKVLVVLGASIILVHIEHLLKPWLPFAALVAVMTIGFIILEKQEHMAHEISAKLGKIWIFAEIVLFAMVGAQVNLPVALKAGLAGITLIGLGLIARSTGSYLCLMGSNLTLGERMFVVISYIPKATVQAAIGAAPLAAMKLAGMDTAPGEIILTVAVLSILLTAPLGAWAIAITGEKVLQTAPASIHEAFDAAVESNENNPN